MWQWKWRFRFGSPSKNVMILVVTGNLAQQASQGKLSKLTWLISYMASKKNKLCFGEPSSQLVNPGNFCPSTSAVVIESLGPPNWAAALQGSQWNGARCFECSRNGSLRWFKWSTHWVQYAQIYTNTNFVKQLNNQLNMLLCVYIGLIWMSVWNSLSSFWLFFSWIFGFVLSRSPWSFPPTSPRPVAAAQIAEL